MQNGRATVRGREVKKAPWRWRQTLDPCGPNQEKPGAAKDTE